jgi:glucose 1-dehydrogenase
MVGKLEGKVALITGAGSGIGAATARLLAADGASVALAGIPADALQRVAEGIGSSGGSAVALPTDVSDSAQVQAAVRETVSRLGRLDIVVASAGVQMHREDRDLHTLDEAVWDRTHAVNYRGVMLTCKHALAQMVEQGDGGSIVIVSSITALTGTSANVSYMSGKTGLLGLNRYIAVHYAKHGIRCNAVLPGALERTPDHERHPDAAGREKALKQKIPLGRLGTPEDIAPMVAFLCSPDASYATGGEFVIDGGVTVI